MNKRITRHTWLRNELVLTQRPIFPEDEAISSIGHGGTSTLFCMMEQFDSMGVQAHFSL